ncbi:MAG: hypothetical protein IH989_02695, partial [Planctomycetes bacterium]|nr:hypothetical protein [Planctomycetota bacterium]
ESRELGFPYWAKEVLVSHAYVHSEMVNTPVDVGGLTVNPGDLLVADRHGVISIPREAASRLPELARWEHERESIVIGLCKSGEKVTPEKLQAAMDEMQEILRSGPSY